MILPDDKDIAWRNMWGGIGVVSVFGLIAYVLASFNPSVVQLVIACQGLAMALVFVIGRFTATLNEQQIFQQQSSRFLKIMSILFFSTLIAQFVWTSPEAAAAAQDSYAVALAKYQGNSPACLSSISEGAWTTVPCPANPLPTGVSSLNSLAFCEQDLWSWAPHSDDCPIAKLTTTRAASAFKDKDILFVGDSVVRSSYHQFISLLEPKYEQNHSFVFKHQDFSHVIPGSNASVRFIWAPFVADIAKVFQTRLPLGGKPVSYIVAGASLWDALHDHDLSKFDASLKTVAAALPTAYQGIGANRTSTVKVWLLPTNILDDRLTTAEKRQYMNDDTIRTYRATAAKSTALQQAFHVLVDPTNATGRRESTSTDGVHYAEEVYSVIAQMLANAYTLHFPSFYVGKGAAHATATAKPYKPKPTGAMSNPSYGAGMLVLIVIMLFTMDSWLGIGWLSLVLGGTNYDWDVAYGPYVRKIQQHQQREAAAVAAAAAAGGGGVGSLVSSVASTAEVIEHGHGNGADKSGELEMLLQRDRDHPDNKA